VDFDSSFNLLRVLREDPARFYRRVEATVRARRQGTRVMLSVGGWAGFWSGYGVHPIAFREWIFDRQAGHLRPAEGLDGPMYGARVDAWPDFDNLFRTLLRAYRSRGLRLHIAFGDAQIITPDPAVEIALHERLARIAAEEGGAQVIALWEVTNEYPMNRHGGGSDASITQMGRVIAAVKSYLPDVLCGQGAALSEEPDDLARSVRVGDVCISHPPRSPIDVCFKRTMNLVYWENNPYRGFPVPFVQAEPKGPNVGPMDGIGDDMYLPTNDPGEITALYALHHLTGQWSTFFDGAAVRSIGESDEAWGFDELPAIFDRHLPEDVATWDRSTAGRGAILYWSRGDQCATAYHSSWDPTPPRPIAEWTHYGTGVTTGTGPPPRETGFLVGRF